MLNFYWVLLNCKFFFGSLPKCIFVQGKHYTLSVKLGLGIFDSLQFVFFISQNLYLDVGSISKGKDEKIYINW